MTEHWNTTPHFKIEQAKVGSQTFYLLNIESEEIVCEIYDMATFESLIAAPDDIIWPEEQP